MAEILVCAEPSWREALSPSVRNKWPQYKKDSYAARTRVGDIVLIKPNGWEWGNEERLPKFVVIMVPDITYEQAQQYRARIEGTADAEGNKKLLRHRRFSVPPSFVQDMINLGQSTTTVMSADLPDKIVDNL